MQTLNSLSGSHNNRGALKTRDWKTRNWKTRHQIAGVEKAEPKNPAPNRMGGKGGTKKPGTKSHGWKTRDWKTRHQITGVENAGPENGGTSKLWKAVAVENVQHS